MHVRRAVRSLIAVVPLALLAGCGADASLPRPYSVLTAEKIQKALVAQRGRIIVLNLWATWCEPCREEFPALMALAEQYSDRDVRVIGLSVDEPELLDPAVRPFVEEIGARFPIWLKAPGDPMDFLDALEPRLSGALPETLIYDREGNVSEILTGGQTLEKFTAAVERAIAAGGETAKASGT